MKFYKKFLIISMTLMLAACAGMPENQSVNVSPQLSKLQPENIGQGRAVAVSVVDHSYNVQNNGHGINFVLVPNGTNDIAVALQDGLRKLGFNPVEQSANPTRELVADLKMLMYYVNAKNGSRNVVANFQITAYNHGKAIAHSYQSRIPVSMLGSQPEYYVNQALAAVMTQALNDKLMMQFLAQ